MVLSTLHPRGLKKIKEERAISGIPPIIAFVARRRRGHIHILYKNAREINPLDKRVTLLTKHAHTHTHTQLRQHTYPYLLPIYVCTYSTYRRRHIQVDGFIIVITTPKIRFLILLFALQTFCRLLTTTKRNNHKKDAII